MCNNMCKIKSRNTSIKEGTGVTYAPIKAQKAQDFTTNQASSIMNHRSNGNARAYKLYGLNDVYNGDGVVIGRDT